MHKLEFIFSNSANGIAMAKGFDTNSDEAKLIEFIKEQKAVVSAHYSTLSLDIKRMLRDYEQDATDLFISIYTSRSPLPVQHLLMALFGLEFSTSSNYGPLDVIRKDFGEDVVLTTTILDSEQTAYRVSVMMPEVQHILLRTPSSQEVIGLCKKLSAMDAQEVLAYGEANAVETV